MSTALDLLLKDVFEEECEFGITNEEVIFIQTGIETLVGKFGETVLNRLYSDEDSKFINLSKYLIKLKNRNIRVSRCSKDDIVKVGSFYEKTRNKFPDEFDIIFPVRCFDMFEPTIHFSTEDSKTISHFLEPTYAVSGIIANERENFIYTPPTSNRKIHLDKTTGVSGPARKLQFIYTSDTGRTRNISVDLVPAAIIRGDFSDRCELVQFRDAVKKTGRVHMVRQVITFTETETRFMREILSENHRKIYRILKFLINGHDDISYKFEGTTFREYSSYMLKNFIIHHHYTCTCNDPATLGQCVIDILEDMCKHETTAKMPMLSKHNALNKCLKEQKFFLLPYLKKLKKELELIKPITEKCDYLGFKIQKSISAHYKEEKERQGLPVEIADDVGEIDNNDDDVVTPYVN